MEFVLIALVAAGVVYFGSKKPAAAPGPPGAVNPPPADPPYVPPPMGPPRVQPPGVYPPGTEGAIPVNISIKGGDSGVITATPGGSSDRPEGATIWYGLGTVVVFKAAVRDPFTGFDHFEGAGGMSTRQNPLPATIRQPGYVKAVFAYFGQVGR